MSPEVGSEFFFFSIPVRDTSDVRQVLIKVFAQRLPLSVHSRHVRRELPAKEGYVSKWMLSDTKSTRPAVVERRRWSAPARRRCRLRAW